ncbi:sigma-70 family RNA polymerase sigma factor, partial [Exiguobacterium sp. K1]|uniref:sigma-70 family RNA polymerase sigma factor n=1 Tax=Exiguobacterium sp. K1 TaxID=2980105 RepID=UPI00299DB8D7
SPRTLPNFIENRQVQHIFVIDLSKLKEDMRDTFGVVSSLNDQELISYLSMNDYKNIKVKQELKKVENSNSDNKEKSNIKFEDSDEDKDDELNLEAFFTNMFDSEKISIEETSYKDNSNLFKLYDEKKNDGVQLLRIKEKLIKNNQALVKKLASHYSDRGKSLTIDDLISVGNIGLMKAIDRFDLKYEAQLSTYATYWIVQQMTRTIINEGYMIRIPVHAMEKVFKMRKIEKELEFENIKKSVDVVCEEMGIDKNGYYYLKEIEHKFLHDVSLNSFINTETGTSEVIDFITNIDADYMNNILTIEEIVINNEIKDIVLDEIDMLPYREREVIKLRFGMKDGKTKTLEEIGHIFGVTRERIRQIESKTLKKLKNNKALNTLYDFEN